MAASVTYTFSATYTDGDFVTATFSHNGTVTDEAVVAGKWVVDAAETDAEIYLPVTNAKMLLLLPDGEVEVQFSGLGNDMTAPANQLTMAHLQHSSFKITNNGASAVEVKFWAIGSKD